ncbi:hypothetical protein TBLA_0E04770 [Henningerozyma blattae CBS 6284]|uniref:C2H2-type domain-containing protein n=1 Tax=Henningerozyma blattae (strain ATCC 34711 / CBS 6284 / DSM 70876 / NBRC 10599 / NRRL Y-10934 / UCD 77-7) TaxID=1071380 RepID=I2H577_HENB6|nr:hypothetical protein TBLA_0E04770 [Tetrapisispora blattae CBS 6284]CCH61529.1 hypothetical protein TBLA_0E04770 [Tetrapisispora blattae CBS 6284]
MTSQYTMGSDSNNSYLTNDNSINDRPDSNNIRLDSSTASSNDGLYTTRLTTTMNTNNNDVSPANNSSNPLPIPKKSRTIKTDKPRPYLCQICTRGFVRQEHLRRHQRAHTNEKPFLCVFCGRCFARRDLVLRHQHKLHPTLISMESTEAKINNMNFLKTQKNLNLTSLDIDEESSKHEDDNQIRHVIKINGNKETILPTPANPMAMTPAQLRKEAKRKEKYSNNGSTSTNINFSTSSGTGGSTTTSSTDSNKGMSNSPHIIMNLNSNNIPIPVLNNSISKSITTDEKRIRGMSSVNTTNNNTNNNTNNINNNINGKRKRHASFSASNAFTYSTTDLSHLMDNNNINNKNTNQISNVNLNGITDTNCNTSQYNNHPIVDDVPHQVGFSTPQLSAQQLMEKVVDSGFFNPSLLELPPELSLDVFNNIEESLSNNNSNNNPLNMVTSTTPGLNNINFNQNNNGENNSTANHNLDSLDTNIFKNSYNSLFDSNNNGNNLLGNNLTNNINDDPSLNIINTTEIDDIDPLQKQTPMTPSAFLMKPMPSLMNIFTMGPTLSGEGYTNNLMNYNNTNTNLDYFNYKKSTPNNYTTNQIQPTTINTASNNLNEEEEEDTENPLEISVHRNNKQLEYTISLPNNGVDECSPKNTAKNSTSKISSHKILNTSNKQNLDDKNNTLDENLLNEPHDEGWLFDLLSNPIHDTDFKVNFNHIDDIGFINPNNTPSQTSSRPNSISMSPSSLNSHLQNLSSSIHKTNSSINNSNTNVDANTQFINYYSPHSTSSNLAPSNVNNSVKPEVLRVQQNMNSAPSNSALVSPTYLSPSSNIQSSSYPNLNSSESPITQQQAYVSPTILSDNLSNPNSLRASPHPINNNRQPSRATNIAQHEQTHLHKQLHNCQLAHNQMQKSNIDNSKKDKKIPNKITTISSLFTSRQIDLYNEAHPNNVTKGDPTMSINPTSAPSTNSGTNSMLISDSIPNVTGNNSSSNNISSNQSTNGISPILPSTIPNNSKNHLKNIYSNISTVSSNSTSSSSNSTTMVTNGKNLQLFTSELRNQIIIQMNLENNVFPKLQELNEYVDLYVENFHKYFPFIHLYSIKPTIENAALILAITAIGALFGFHSSHAMLLSNVAASKKRKLFEKYKNNPEVTPLWVIQTIILLSFVNMFSNDLNITKKTYSQLMSLIELVKLTQINQPLELFKQPPIESDHLLDFENKPDQMAEYRAQYVTQEQINKNYEYFIESQSRIRTCHILLLISNLFTSIVGFEYCFHSLDMKCGIPTYYENLFNCMNSKEWNNILISKNIKLDSKFSLIELSNGGENYENFLTYLAIGNVMIYENNKKISNNVLLSLLLSIHEKIFIERHKDDNTNSNFMLPTYTKTPEEDVDWKLNSRPIIESALRSWESLYLKNGGILQINANNIHKFRQDLSIQLIIPLYLLARIRKCIGVSQIMRFVWIKDWQHMNLRLNNLSHEIDNLNESTKHALGIVEYWINSVSIKNDARSTSRRTPIFAITCIFISIFIISERMKYLEGGCVNNNNLNLDISISDKILWLQCEKIFKKVERHLLPKGYNKESYAEFLRIQAQGALDVEILNDEIAERVMKSNKVPINDMINVINKAKLSSRCLYLGVRILGDAPIWPIAVVFAQALQVRAIYNRENHYNI